MSGQYGDVNNGYITLYEDGKEIKKGYSVLTSDINFKWLLQLYYRKITNRYIRLKI